MEEKVNPRENTIGNWDDLEKTGTKRGLRCNSRKGKEQLGHEAGGLIGQAPVLDYGKW